MMETAALMGGKVLPAAFSGSLPEYSPCGFAVAFLGFGFGTGPVSAAGDAQVAEWLMAADCKSARQRATEVRILPCAPVFLLSSEGGGKRVDADDSGTDKVWMIALGVLVVFAIFAWQTMEPGKCAVLTWLLSALFAFRILMWRSGRVRW